MTPGALVTANQATAMATVQLLDPILVDVTQSSSLVLRLKRALAGGRLSGGTATVRLLLEDASAYPLAGKLRFFNLTVVTRRLARSRCVPNSRAPRVDSCPACMGRRCSK